MSPIADCHNTAIHNTSPLSPGGCGPDSPGCHPPGGLQLLSLETRALTVVRALHGGSVDRLAPSAPNWVGTFEGFYFLHDTTKNMMLLASSSHLKTNK